LSSCSLDQTTKFDVDAYVSAALESSALKATIATESDKQIFKEERRQLYLNVFRKSFYLLTGKPGAGKTFEAVKVIGHLRSIHEDVEILAPSGKAVLRITENLRANAGVTDITARTIDKFLFDNFPDVLSGRRSLETVTEGEKLSVENLTLDEASMLDLDKLNTLFSLIKFTLKHRGR
jgi:exodeoxyribonuclease V alpha subunit